LTMFRCNVNSFALIYGGVPIGCRNTSNARRRDSCRSGESSRCRSEPRQTLHFPSRRGRSAEHAIGRVVANLFPLLPLDKARVEAPHSSFATGSGPIVAADGGEPKHDARCERGKAVPLRHGCDRLLPICSSVTIYPAPARVAERPTPRQIHPWDLRNPKKQSVKRHPIGTLCRLVQAQNRFSQSAWP
jgi:hypothetical protein